MRNRFGTALLALVAGTLLSQGSAHSQDEKKAKKVANPLVVLSPFIGEWTVEGMWAGGEKLKARGTYEWGLNRKIIIAKTFVMDGEKEYQRYESIFAMHPQKKSLYEITFGFDGSISEVIIEAKEKDTIHIGYTPFQADKPEKIRQTLKFIDKDHFVWNVQMKQGDDWKQLIEATWVRKK